MNRTVWAAVMLSLLPGCSMSQLSQGIYEGSQTRNQLTTPPVDRLDKRDYYPYSSYERERADILERDNQIQTK